jgi:putative membrane protein
MNLANAMSLPVLARGLLAAGLTLGAPAWAVSLTATGPAQPLPFTQSTAQTAAVPRAETLAPGSASLVPLMAADMAAQEISTVDASTPTSGGDAGKPVDDISFVARATESGRREVKSAQEALPQLRDPSLKQLAELLVNHHGAANERLSKIAEAKGWPVPGPRLEQAAPAAGTSSPGFDARWTAEMIEGHERSVALYRAQAQGGEDKDLRRYAREALPTIEQHLDWLRRLQQ